MSKPETVPVKDTQPWKAGDLVRLKAGGPTLTVEKLNGDIVTVTWFNGSTLERHTFIADMLETATEPAPTTGSAAPAVDPGVDANGFPIAEPDPVDPTTGRKVNETPFEYFERANRNQKRVQDWINLEPEGKGSRARTQLAADLRFKTGANRYLVNVPEDKDQVAIVIRANSGPEAEAFYCDLCGIITTGENRTENRPVAVLVTDDQAQPAVA